MITWVSSFAPAQLMKLEDGDAAHLRGEQPAGGTGDAAELPEEHDSEEGAHQRVCLHHTCRLRSAIQASEPG